MCRHVARVLRLLLLIVGISMMVWYPFSWRYVVGVGSTWPKDRILVGSSYGNATLTNFQSAGGTKEGVTFEYRRLDRPTSPTSLWVPSYTHIDNMRAWGFAYTAYTLPLWLLASLCLAWPVTSFILARWRGKGRGFAVEPAADATPPASTEGALE